MKNVLLSAIVFAGLVPVSGCIIVDDTNNDVCGDGVASGIEACDDNNNANGDGCSASCTIEAGAHVGAKWNIKANNAPVSCPPGFDTARVISHPHALPINNNSQDKIDLFKCSAGQGITAFLTPGAYDVWTEIVNTDGTAVYAQSVPAYVDLTTADKDVTFDIHTDKGYFFLNWVLQGAGGALTCAQVPEAAKISIDTTPATAPTLFDCAQGAGYSIATAAGIYQVAVAAINAQQISIGTSATFANQQINVPNKYTNLGTAMIMITGR